MFFLKKTKKEAKYCKISPKFIYLHKLTIFTNLLTQLKTMKTITKIMFGFIALSALMLTSCNKDDDKELTPRELLSSCQWETMYEGDKMIFDIGFSDPNIFQYTTQDNKKLCFSLSSLMEGDFNGFHFKISTSFTSFFHKSC